MGARIIELAAVRARRSGLARPGAANPGPAARKPEPRLVERFHFWSGASEKRYVHTVYGLIECPELSSGTYVLVRRDTAGRRSALAVGRLTHASPSLNLAEIRQRGATLGADEVHVHLLAATDHEMKLVEFDLRAGQLDAANASRTHH